MSKKSDTIKYGSYTLDVEYDYIPEEPRTYDYPGASAEVEVERVFLQGVDVTELFEEIEGGFERIEELIFEKI